jgi:hypothetical protein
MAMSLGELFLPEGGGSDMKVNKRRKVKGKYKKMIDAITRKLNKKKAGGATE